VAESANLTIDCTSVEAKQNMTLMDAADPAGIHIPNLRYLKGLKGIGVRRLCSAQIDGLNPPCGCLDNQGQRGDDASDPHIYNLSSRTRKSTLKEEVFYGS